jgi:hypothetical protein
VLSVINMGDGCPNGTTCTGVSECKMGGGTCVGDCKFGCCCQYPTPSECPSDTTCTGVTECKMGGGTCVGSCQFGCCCKYPTPTPTPSLLQRLLELLRRLFHLGG